MHKLFITIVVLVFSTAFFACEETIKLDLDQTPSRLVIEGLVTNIEGKNYVRVSRSVDFYQEVISTPVNDATIVVSDDQGQQFPFSPTGADGMYQPDPTFRGEIGRIYSLSVNVDNQLVEATDEMMPVTQFDSINYRLNEDELEDPEEEGKVYELVMFAKEPQDRKDYYLFKFYRNDSLKVYGDTDLYYTDDTVLGERIEGLSSPVFFGENDTAEIQMLSLTRNGYLFYNDLAFLINTDGGMFGPPPANPRTNLTNNALGFFQVSAMDTARLVIR